MLCALRGLWALKLLESFKFNVLSHPLLLDETELFLVRILDLLLSNDLLLVLQKTIVTSSRTRPFPAPRRRRRRRRVVGWGSRGQGGGLLLVILLSVLLLEQAAKQPFLLLLLLLGWRHLWR